jgi:alpha-glucosidase
MNPAKISWLQTFALNLKSVARQSTALRYALPLFIAFLFVGCSGSAPRTSSHGVPTVSVKSPDGTIQLTLSAQGPLTYSVLVDGKVLLADSKLGLRFKDGTAVGANSRLTQIERRSADQVWQNPFGKRRDVRDRHNELRASYLESSGRSFQIELRAFDDGIGFRYALPGIASAQSQEFVLEEELTQFCFPGNYLCYCGINENTGKTNNPVGYIGSQESEYKPCHLLELPTDQVRMLPLLVQAPAAWIAITESDLYDWAGMWINRAPAGPDVPNVTLACRLAPRLDGQGLVKSMFPRQSPWRTLLIARQPGRIIESDLVLNLASPSVLSDVSWIKPGIASWDWWSQMTRPTTETFKELINFSAEMGWS